MRHYLASVHVRLRQYQYATSRPSTDWKRSSCTSSLSLSSRNKPPPSFASAR